MWIVLLFAGFVAVGLRRGTAPGSDTAAAVVLIFVMLMYVSLTKHLL
jgi:hypothetical protein